jgi:hypothetical protein
LRHGRHDPDAAGDRAEGAVDVDREVRVDVVGDLLHRVALDAVDRPTALGVVPDPPAFQTRSAIAAPVTAIPVATAAIRRRRAALIAAARAADGRFRTGSASSPPGCFAAAARRSSVVVRPVPQPAAAGPIVSRQLDS